MENTYYLNQIPSQNHTYKYVLFKDYKTEATQILVGSKNTPHAQIVQNYMNDTDLDAINIYGGGEILHTESKLLFINTSLSFGTPSLSHQQEISHTLSLSCIYNGHQTPHQKLWRIQDIIKEIS